MARDKMKSASRHSFHDDHGSQAAPARPSDAALPFDGLIREMLVQLGEDPTREGLRRTTRVETSLKWLTRGYGLRRRGDRRRAPMRRTTTCVRARHRDLPLCEHHMLPFFSKAHVAYLPNSLGGPPVKIPAVIEVFARRHR
jgi:GTP cyclohydrolase I